jgi:hypothetical protein
VRIFELLESGQSFYGPSPGHKTTPTTGMEWPIVIADVLDDIHGDDLDLGQIVGSIKPGFPKIWIEGRVTHPGGVVTPTAWLVTDEEDIRRISIQLFQYVSGHIVTQKIDTVHYNEDGTVRRETCVSFFDQRLAESAARAGRRLNFSENLAVAALAFMNCRNVKLHESETKPTKSRKRRGLPGIRFSTIVLPGSLGVGGAGAQTGTTALHIVRGHFKTYTEEAPLFGKLTGTYWWGSHVAGNPENGVVVSDYRIEIPA